jgi:glycerol-3-phosphate acyltransferase PlsY
MPHPLPGWSFVWPYFLAAFAGGYLLGSIPFGLLLTRLAGLGDIRKVGSGNIGATNVLRTGRRGLAAATLILDALKGAAAVLIAQLWGPDMALMAGYGALAGHLFPVWLGFKGGKGVATTLGVLLAVSWEVGLAACATWLVVAAVFRYSSLAALVAVAAAAPYGWIIGGDLQLVEFAGILAVFVWAKHHANIRRLVTGTEPRIGRKQAGGAAA